VVFYQKGASSCGMWASLVARLDDLEATVQQKNETIDTLRCELSTLAERVVTLETVRTVCVVLLVVCHLGRPCHPSGPLKCFVTSWSYRGASPATRGASWS
jgi:hypothetical protein